MLTDQKKMLVKSVCKKLQSISLLIYLKGFTSSAYYNILELHIQTTTSLIKILNKQRPKLETEVTKYLAEF